MGTTDSTDVAAGRDRRVALLMVDPQARGAPKARGRGVGADRPNLSRLARPPPAITVTPWTTGLIEGHTREAHYAGLETHGSNAATGFADRSRALQVVGE